MTPSFHLWHAPSQAFTLVTTPKAKAMTFECQQNWIALLVSDHVNVDANLLLRINSGDLICNDLTNVSMG